MADSKPNEFTKKKFERKVAPSKAPLRLLKKKQRDLQRLLQNKDKLKDLPEDVVKDTETKLKDITAQVNEMSQTNQSKAEQDNKAKEEKKAAAAAAKKSTVNQQKLTELRRSTRKVRAFKKQHPNYASSEEESKAFAELELDLLYIKHYPKDEEYISIFPESSLTEDQIKARAEIRSKIESAVASGEIKKGSAQKNDSPATEAATNGKRPASNWSDDEDEEESDDNDDSNKKLKQE
ncbi:hypothetical protein EMPS_01718 [Entomortierella parvispora]|uniref:rRNA-processing protein EFG1 n=1 Tax=Entomortierella parvispora TaxID=205924 RepID=A0A9P3H3H8_9FUNG|nr:hypothetical protein EMPS_01718 [Entomortierella parvispora]